MVSALWETIADQEMEKPPDFGRFFISMYFCMIHYYANLPLHWRRITEINAVCLVHVSIGGAIRADGGESWAHAML